MIMKEVNILNYFIEILKYYTQNYKNFTNEVNLTHFIVMFAVCINNVFPIKINKINHLFFP